MSRYRFSFIICLVFGLVGCSNSGENPQMIASFPAEFQDAIISPNLVDMTVVYNAIVEIEVANVDKAAEKANNIAYEHGGYPASSQSWYREGKKYTTLVLSVPVHRFDTAHRDLLRLGDLVSEWVTGELRSFEFRDNGWQTFAAITLHLVPKHPVWPTIHLPDWRPAQTFAKAWQVLASIFSFLVDIIIWVGVVTGPFIFLGWIVRKLIRRRKKDVKSE